MLLQRKTIIVYGLLGLIIVFGFLLRTSGLFTKNILFLYDNGRDLLFVKKIVIDHKLLLIGAPSGLQGYFHGVLWYYLLAIPFAIGKGNPAVVNGFMAVLSTSSILLAFITLKRIAGTFAGFIAATVFAVAPFSVATTAFPWNPYPIVWLMPLYSFFLYVFVQEKRYALFFISFLTAIICQFELMYGITLVPTLLFVLLIAVRRKKTIKERVNTLVIAGIVFLLPFLPMLFFDVRHHFLITSAIFKTFTSGGASVTHNASQQPLSLVERITSRTHDLYAYTVQAVSRNAYVNIALFLVFLTGVYHLIKKEQSKDCFLLLLFIATLFVPFFLFLTLRYAVWDYYWIGSAGLYVCTLAFVIGYFLKRRNSLQSVLYVLLLFLIISSVSWETIAHWYKGTLTPGTQVLSPQLRVVNAIEYDAGSKPFSVYVQTPPVYDYVYRYLFWWQGNIQYHHFPQDQKQSLTYLILEGTPTDPSGRYFKQHVVNTEAAPVQTFRFPGITVEKILTVSDKVNVDINYFPPLQ